MSSDGLDDLEQQEQELLALESIYGDYLTRDDGARCCTLHLTEPGAQPHALLRVHLARDYPSQAPPVCEVVAPHLPDDAKQLIAAALPQQFVPGEVALFSFFEHVRSQPQLWQAPAVPSLHESNVKRGSGGAADSVSQDPPPPSVSNPSTVADNACAACLRLGVVHGDPFVEKKSTFQAHVARINSADQVDEVMAALLQHTKIRSATHNIIAYRLVDEERGRVVQDCDDDGESAAGGRLLHMLQCAQVRNVVVVVSRWYGGIHLGPARFQIINNVGRQLLEQAGFIDGAPGGVKAAGKGKKGRT